MSVLNFDNRYRVVAELGRGGMGVVYKAEDTLLGRVVALKRLLVRGKPIIIERFLSEAKSAAQLNHPNIVTVFDINKDAEGLFIVSEFVDGADLNRLLRAKGPLPATTAVRIMNPVLAAMSAVHKKGIIHRDLKPANILVTHELMPKIADFGLARLDEDKDREMTGMVMGTQNYASPEQFRDSKHIDHRSDIFSLGAVFFEVLTGKKPQYMRESELPPAFAKIILKATAHDVKDRYKDLDQMLADVESVMALSRPKPKVVAAPERAAKPASLRPAEAALRNMILIPAGPFLYGESRTTLHLAPYYIDRYPVTNAEYAQFRPTHAFRPEEADHPATRVSFLDADAYARSVGKRLPTEEEWEKAAAGGDGNEYPWGRQFLLGRCNSIESGIGATTPVNAFPDGKSCYGVIDMAGNVWEWTSTKLAGTLPRRILKGGAFNGESKYTRCSARFAYLEKGLTPHFGFRCVCPAT